MQEVIKNIGAITFIFMLAFVFFWAGMFIGKVMTLVIFN